MPADHLQTSLRGTSPRPRYLSTWLIIAICVLVSAGMRGRNSARRKKPKPRPLIKPESQSASTTIARDMHNRSHRQKVWADHRPTNYRHSQRDATSLKRGAQVASTKIVTKDYITIQGNAYVSIIGQTSILTIQHAVDLYHAANDRYPKDYDEFMTEIIKANNIALPVLPPYQKYGYDENEHKLIILEYKDLKKYRADCGSRLRTSAMRVVE